MKKSIFLAIFFICFSFLFCFSQNKSASERISSSSSTVKTSKEASIAKLKIEEYLKNDNYNLCIEYSNALLKSETETLNKGFILTALAECYANKKELKKAFEYYLLAEKNIDNQNKPFFYSKLGLFYTQVNDYTKAMGALKNAYNFAIHFNDERALILIYNSIAYLNNLQKDFDTAIVYYEKSLVLSKKYKDYYQMGISYNNITTCQIKTKSLNYVITELLKSKAILDKVNSDEKSVNQINFNIASVYVSLNKIDLAKKYLEEVKEYTIRKKNTNLYTYCLLTEGDILEKENKVDLSIVAYKNALSSATSISDVELISLANLKLSEVYEKKKDYLKSLYHFKNYKKNNDIVYNSAKEDHIKELQIKFDISNYKQNLKAKSQEIELLNIKSEKSNFKLMALIVFIIMLLLFAVRQYKIIHIKKKNEDYQNEINALKEINFQNEVAFKNKQVTDFALQIQEQNVLLEQFKKNLAIIKSKSNEKEILDVVSDTNYMINNNIELNHEKIQLNTDITESQNNFLLTLKNQYPNLNDKEIKVCTLMRLNLNTKQIALQLGISEHSIQNYRYEIRKKMNLDKTDNLSDFLKKI